MGADGPWEPKRILGTVPVEKDGSAFFRVPANIPISMQPLDAEGKALQLMRSWTTAMPGELVSCTGCHDKQNSAPSGTATIASRRKASEIQPWHGPTRGFSFSREVQPVLDKHCVGCHGTWRETVGIETMATDHARRFELRKLYGGSTDDPETISEEANDTFKHAEYATERFARQPQVVQPPRPKYASSSAAKITHNPKYISLGEGVRLKMVYIAAGEFVMGQADGLSDEQPACLVKVEKPFWMSACEITNEQYGLFNPAHDSRHEHGTASFNSERATGPKLNRPDQPVLRISWKEAVEFCKWSSEKTGLEVSLPTEAQWEYACRAGTSTALSFGSLDDDFSRFANVSDATMNGWATYNEKRRSADIVPRDSRFDDEALVSTSVGSYRPNRWGLHDMHGNVWEWTRSDYAQYPYDEQDGRNSQSPTARKVVRGGSWYDRPKRCRSSFRLSYPPWRRVFNVGFRVVFEAEQPSSEVVASLPLR